MDEKRLFGEIAIDLGLITTEQLWWALERQRSLRARGLGHMLLGQVLVDMGLVSGEQILEVMTAYDQENPVGDDSGRVRVGRESTRTAMGADDTVVTAPSADALSSRGAGGDVATRKTARGDTRPTDVAARADELRGVTVRVSVEGALQDAETPAYVGSVHNDDTVITAPQAIRDESGPLHAATEPSDGIDWRALDAADTDRVTADARPAETPSERRAAEAMLNDGATMRSEVRPIRAVDAVTIDDDDDMPPLDPITDRSPVVGLQDAPTVRITDDDLTEDDAGS